MKRSHLCAKCGYDELLILPETGHYGLFEAYVCRECGYSELYARDGGQEELENLPGVSVVGQKRSEAYR